ESRSEHIKRRIELVQVGDQRARKVVAQVHVVRIEQQRALGPLLARSASPSAASAPTANPIADPLSGSTATIFSQRSSARRAARRAPSLSPIAEWLLTSMPADRKSVSTSVAAFS